MQERGGRGWGMGDARERERGSRGCKREGERKREMSLL